MSLYSMISWFGYVCTAGIPGRSKQLLTDGQFLAVDLTAHAVLYCGLRSTVCPYGMAVELCGAGLLSEWGHPIPESRPTDPTLNPIHLLVMVASHTIVATNLVLASLAGLAIYKLATFPRPEPLDDVELNVLRIWTRYDRGDFDNDDDAVEAVKRQISELESRARVFERSDLKHARALETELLYTYELISDLHDDLRPIVFQFYRAYYHVRNVYGLSHALTLDMDPILFKQIVMAARFCQVVLDDSDYTMKGRLRSFLLSKDDNERYIEAVDRVIEQITVVELTELQLRAAQIKEAADSLDQERFKTCLQAITDIFSELESQIVSKLST